MKYGLINRVLLSSFILISLFLSLLSFAIFTNFLIDDPYHNLDQYGLTRMSLNSFAYICDYLECHVHKTGIVMKLIINIMMMSIFWLQYLIINNQDLRFVVFHKINDEFLYYVKIICKIFTYFSLIMMIQIYQPTLEEKYSYLEENKYLFKNIFFIVKLCALIFFISTLKFHLVKNDSLNIGLLTKLILDKEIIVSDDILYNYSIPFNLCRSPLRSSIILFLLISNLNWNIGKLLFVLFIIGGLYADSVAEEVYYLKFNEYQNYKKNILNRFIPKINYLFNLNNKSTKSE